MSVSLSADVGAVAVSRNHAVGPARGLAGPTQGLSPS
jgi:hypothetical protein